MPNVPVHITTILIAATITILVGAFWYHPSLFGKQWLELVGRKPKDWRQNILSGSTVAAIGALVMAYVLAHFVVYTGSTTLGDGVRLGLWVWLAFVATTSAISTIFAGRPHKLWLIDSGYFLVAIVLNSIVLSVWR